MATLATIATIQKELKNAENTLINFCNDMTPYDVEVVASDFPVKAILRPQSQLSIDGTIRGDIAIEVGMSTKVTSPFLGSIDAEILKKLIKLTEKFAGLYYLYFTAASCLDTAPNDETEDTTENENENERK